MVVFFADGFVRLAARRQGPPARQPARNEGRDEGRDRDRDREEEDGRRFLRVSARLPLELQMVLCNRVFGSGRNGIRSRDSELGFRWLTLSLLVS